MNRKTAPPITYTSQLDLQLKSCRRLTLDNGVEVWLMEAGEQEVMMVEWVFNAGNWFEEKNLVSGATSFLLKTGTDKLTAFDINEAFEYYGAYLKRESYSENATITLHSLSKHIPHVLPKVSEIIRQSVMPQHELEIFVQNAIQNLRVNLKKCDFVANRLIDIYLYGEEHPYGSCSSVAAYEALNRDDCAAFYEKYYQQTAPRLFVAGKLHADIDKLLNDNFGQYPVQPRPEIFSREAKPATEKKYRIENDPNGVQGAIRLARHFGNRHHPDFMGCMVLNNLFGGFFGSRLMSNIREDKGYTYGIYSYIQNHQQQSAWMVATEAGRDVCEATIAEVYKEMEILRTELVDEEELLLVRNYMMGQLLGDLDGPFQLIGRWKTYVLNGLDGSFFDRYVQTIKTITPEEIRELARKYLNPEDFYELVVI
jgi:zinc protease